LIGKFWEKDCGKIGYVENLLRNIAENLGQVGELLHNLGMFFSEEMCTT
jgi:hypothetical protein